MTRGAREYAGVTFRWRHAGEEDDQTPTARNGGQHPGAVRRTTARTGNLSCKLLPLALPVRQSVLAVAVGASLLGIHRRVRALVLIGVGLAHVVASHAEGIDLLAWEHLVGGRALASPGPRFVVDMPVGGTRHFAQPICAFAWVTRIRAVRSSKSVSASRFAKARAARMGPTVCELLGPTPMVNMSSTLVITAYNLTNSVCISPVTRAPRSSTKRLISVRTPKSGR